MKRFVSTKHLFGQPWVIGGVLLASLAAATHVSSQPILAPMPRLSAPTIAQTGSTANLWRDVHLVRTLVGHSGTIDALAFSPDGKTLISGGGFNDGRIRLWNIKNGDQIGKARAHRMAVLGLAIAPNGQTFATCSDDTTLRLWSWKTEEVSRTFLDHSDNILSLAITPDSHTLISGGLDGIKRWDLTTQRPIDTLVTAEDIYSVAISPDGKTLASGNSKGMIELWDLETGKLTYRVMGHRGAVKAISFTADGQTLVSGSYDHSIKVWNLSTGQLLHTLEHNSRINALAISPDGQAIASASQDGVTLWDLNTGELLTTLTGHAEWVQSVAFSPDGTTLASGGFDKTIKLWRR